MLGSPYKTHPQFLPGGFCILSGTVFDVKLIGAHSRQNRGDVRIPWGLFNLSMEDVATQGRPVCSRPHVHQGQLSNLESRCGPMLH